MLSIVTDDQSIFIESFGISSFRHFIHTTTHLLVALQVFKIERLPL